MIKIYGFQQKSNPITQKLFEGTNQLYCTRDKFPQSNNLGFGIKDLKRIILHNQINDNSAKSLILIP